MTLTEENNFIQYRKTAAGMRNRVDTYPSVQLVLLYAYTVPLPLAWPSTLRTASTALEAEHDSLRN